MAAQVDERFAVVRYRDDGTVDPAFGDAGVARVSTASRPNGSAGAVFVAPDGRIVAAGQTNATLAEQAFTVARLTPAGAPDPTFAGTGVVTETFDESSAASVLVPLPDGRFYAVGSTADFWGDDEGGGTTRRAAIVRYLANGDRDDSFAGDGSVLDALGQGLYATVAPTAAAVDADGRLALATGRGAIARYTPGGARDAAFGSGARSSCSRRRAATRCSRSPTVRWCWAAATVARARGRPGSSSARRSCASAPPARPATRWSDSRAGASCGCATRACRTCCGEGESPRTASCSPAFS